MKILLTVILMFSFIAPLFAQSITISPNNTGLQQNIKVFGDRPAQDFPEFVGNRGRGTSATPANTQEGDILLSLSGNGFRTLGSNPTSLTSASIDFIASSDFTNTTGGGEIRFFTGNLTSLGGSTGNYRMTLTNSGSLGIGIATPSSRLHVRGLGTSGVTAHVNAKVFVEDNANTYLNFGTPDANESGILFGKPSYGSTSGGIIYTANRDLQFRTSTNDNRMVITEAGNVGIGTSTPTAKLEVLGDIKISRIRFDAHTSIGFDPLDRQNTSYHVINTDAGVTVFLRGISAPVSGTGTMFYLIVAGDGVVILQNDNATNSNDRILNHTNADITLSGRGSAIYIYDDGWRLLSFTQ